MKACRGRNHLHPQDHRSQRTSFVHPPSGSRLPDCRECCLAQRASWFRWSFCHTASAARRSHDKFPDCLESSLQFRTSLLHRRTWRTSYLPCLSVAHTDLLGGVESHGVHDVAKVEEVELALAVPVIDVADLLASFGVNHD